MAYKTPQASYKNGREACLWRLSEYRHQDFSGDSVKNLATRLHRVVLAQNQTYISRASLFQSIRQVRTIHAH